MKAYWKDIARTIKNGKKRFCSIVIITVLGVTMYTGISAACRDLRYGADELFDDQNLYDIRIVSTLGLTDDDIQVLQDIEGVGRAEGAYSETVLTQAGEKQQEAEVKVLRENGLSQPALLKGTLPTEKNEIAVTENYCKDTGKTIGDTLVLEPEDKEKEQDKNETGNTVNSGEDAEEAENDPDSGDDAEDEFAVEWEEKEASQGLTNFTYRITAVVLDPTDLIADEGAAAYRSSESTEYCFFVTEDAVDSDIYTAVELTVSGAKDLMCYSDEYTEKVNEVSNVIKDEIKSQREQARYDEITQEATGKLEDTRRKINEKFQEADDKIADAKAELEDGRLEIESGWKKINDGMYELERQEQTANREFADAYAKIQEGYARIQTGQQQLEESGQQLQSGKEQLAAGKAELEARQEEAYSQIETGKNQITSARTEAVSGQAQIQKQTAMISGMLGEAWPEEAWNHYVQSTKEAYHPLIAQQIQQEMSGEQADGAASTGEAAVQPDHVSPDELAAQTAAKCAEAQTEFMAVFTPVIDGMSRQIDGAIAMLDPTMEGYEAQVAALTAQKQQLEGLVVQLPVLAEETGKVNATISVLDSQMEVLNQSRVEAEAQFAEAWNVISEKERTLQSGEQELSDGKRQLESGKAELDNGLTELKNQETKARQQIADARIELEEGKQDLIDGQKELDDGALEIKENEQKLADSKTEAEEKLADAQAEIDDIDMTKWYVQDRTSIGSFTTVEGDAACIETIGTVFPILFLAVAILISLTTITRMVEEERGLIGIYKALGFTNRSIYGKYLIYTVSACLLGGLLGDFCGFIALPKFLFMVFEMMYKMPSYPLLFHVGYGTTGILLFVAGVVGAAFVVCHSELQHMPAVLMRPKAPKAGSRVFLELLPFVWKRMSFLNKVTTRNLFRYKKRLIMTVGGIMGCTALVLLGMAIRDSVTGLMPKQYNHIYQYDLMAVSMAEDNEKVTSQLSADDAIADYLNVQIESIQVKTGDTGEEESVQLFVVPESDSLNGYILLEGLDNEQLSIPDDGILVTENLSDVMAFDAGDTLKLQNLDLVEKEAEVSAIVHNYLGNSVYMTKSCYEKLFGEYEPNGVLAHLSDSCTDHTAYADDLARESDVITSVSTQSMRDEFSKAFSLVNSVVVLVTVLAAGLAFVVLFTLATTNISERERELATIKVLGFFDREVHLYVNKETIILTLIGIVLGLPAGRFVSGLLTSILKMPAVYFAVSVQPFSYIFAAGMTLIFALIVNLITNRSLDGIDMVDALKSIE